MSAGGFELCYPITLGYERGYCNNPRDPGGATMDGITQAVYDADRERRGLAWQPVRYSTEAERQAIYRARYWSRAGCEDLPAGIDYAVFDFAVNSGVGRAVRTLQRCVGATPDGVFGRRTMTHVTQFCGLYGATALTDEVCQERVRFLRALPTFATFGVGWIRRVMGHEDGAQAGDTGVIDRAFDMARGHMPAMPTRQMPTQKTYLGRSP